MTEFFMPMIPPTVTHQEKQVTVSRLSSKMPGRNLWLTLRTALTRSSHTLTESG